MDDEPTEAAPDTTVCHTCLSEPEYLTEFIRNRASERSCSYCGKTARRSRAIPLETLMGVIRPAVMEEYEDAAESVLYDSREGGYQMTTHTTEEVLYDLGVFSQSDRLMTDIADSLPDYAWVRRDPYSLSRFDALQFGWAAFSQLVKHHTRFLFFRRPPRLLVSHDEIQPGQMLDELGSLVNELGLVSTIPAGTTLYRVRQHKASVRPHDLASLGPPPEECARYANRMSPAGISMLYASFDPLTAAAETLNRHKLTLAMVTTAEIQTTRQIRVLDLTRLPPIPNVFDPTVSRDKRHLIAFIHSFTADLTKPVTPDGREHIEYVPSQVVTEYFRFRFRTEARQRVKGIEYPSAVRPGSASLVLFIGAKECAPVDVLGRPTQPDIRLARYDSRPLRGHP